MPSEQQLIEALRQADANGDTEAAQRFAELIKEGRQQAQIEGESTTLNTVNSVLPGPARAAVQLGSAIFGRDKVEGVQRAAADGALLGFGDEIEAGAESVVTDKSYTESRDMIRAQKAQFQKENPKTALAANVAGGFLTGGAGASRSLAANAGKTIGAKVLSGTLTGATLGSVAGLGSSEAELAGEDKDIAGAVRDTAIGGAVGGVLGGATTAVPAYLSSRAAKNDALKQALTNNPDSRVAKYMVDGAGKVTKDKVAIESIRQGFDEGVVSVVKGAKAQDKANMRRMLNTLIRGKRNPTEAIRNRPADIIGQTVAKRYKYVENQKKLAGSAVDRAAKSLKGQQVDYRPVVEKFVDTLDDVGVKLKTDGRVTLDFDGSDFEGMKGVQSAIKRVVTRMTDTRTPDAYDIHRLKRYIDNSVDYQKSAGGMTGQAERIVKQLRHNLDELLDGNFEAYDIANQRYAKSLNALNEIDALVGKNGATDRSIGTLTRRISSNAMSGGRVDQAITNLDQTAAELGGRFSDDLDTLVVFANELERKLGSSARTSLQGQGENVANQMRNVADKGAYRAVVDKGFEVISGIRGVNEENAIKSLQRLLSEQ